nr:hypothetical protein [Kineococcus indalonis]
MAAKTAGVGSTRITEAGSTTTTTLTRAGSVIASSTVPSCRRSRPVACRRWRATVTAPATTTA